MTVLREQKLLTKQEFDEEIEWTWFYLWHHEGRRARHGASMMAPDYAHWHGMYEVADRFYMQLIPQAREIAQQADEAGQPAEAEAVRKVIEDLLARPEHAWYEEMKVTRKAGLADDATVEGRAVSDVADDTRTSAEAAFGSQVSPAATGSTQTKPVAEPKKEEPAQQ